MEYFCPIEHCLLFLALQEIFDAGTWDKLEKAIDINTAKRHIDPSNEIEKWHSHPRNKSSKTIFTESHTRSSPNSITTRLDTICRVAASARRADSLASRCLHPPPGWPKLDPCGGPMVPTNNPRARGLVVFDQRGPSARSPPSHPPKRKWPPPLECDLRSIPTCCTPNRPHPPTSSVCSSLSLSVRTPLHCARDRRGTAAWWVTI